MNTNAFRITSVRLPDGAFVIAEGEMDFASGAIVRSVVLGAARTASMIEIDLGLVTFIDTAGLNALSEVRDIAAEHGYVLRIGKTSEPVRRIMDLMHWQAPAVALLIDA